MKVSKGQSQPERVAAAFPAFPILYLVLGSPCLYQVLIVTPVCFACDSCLNRGGSIDPHTSERLACRVCQAFSWSLSLISKILMRVIQQGAARSRDGFFRVPAETPTQERGTDESFGGFKEIILPEAAGPFNLTAIGLDL